MAVTFCFLQRKESFLHCNRLGLTFDINNGFIVTDGHPQSNHQLHQIILHNGKTTAVFMIGTTLLEC